MNQTPAPAGEPESGRYEIRLKGRLDTRWSTWFGGLNLTHEGGGTTTIRGASPTRPRCTACSSN